MTAAAERAGPDVLADVLILASEVGPDRLVELDRLLRDVVGDGAVNEAHETWTARLRAGISGAPAPESDGVDVPDSERVDVDVLNLLGRLHPTTPARVRR